MGDYRDGDSTITLIGPDEPRFWDVFTASPEFRNNAADPLDRWSRRVIAEVAAQMGADPIFPFGGPPYAPFYSWAIATGRFWPSPIGCLVHEEAGLLASFRGALRWNVTAAVGRGPQPCLTCAAPCKTTCPVGAFANGYDVAACKAHVLSAEGRACREGGCLARRACPVGAMRRLPAQSAFHMEAFL